MEITEYELVDVSEMGDVYFVIEDGELIAFHNETNERADIHDICICSPAYTTATQQKLTDNWKPGDLVILTGYVYAYSAPDGWAHESQILPTGYEVVDANYVDQKGRNVFRTLTRVDYFEPIRAMILGWSTRQIGRVHPAVISPDTPYGPEEYEPAWFEIDKTFKVWYAMPLDPHQRNRYRKPVTALPEQIKDIE